MSVMNRQNNFISEVLTRYSRVFVPTGFESLPKSVCTPTIELSVCGKALWKIVTIAALTLAPASAQIPYATDAPKPLSPEESVEAFRLPSDLRIELVASEPQILEPGAMAFDEFGRLYVGELHGYNLEGYYDILELNNAGVLDREVRRVRVEGTSLERARNEATGVIKQLEDRDSDGHFETAHIWADNLPSCYGLIPARDGIIAVTPPKIVYLADLDNDGRAEVRETLFTGFSFEVLERGINSSRRGPDDWVYVAAGGGGGAITGPNLPEPVRIGHTDFRFRDDGSAIEPVVGTCGTFGMALTDFGDRFITSTNNHALYATPLEYRHLVRNTHVPSPGGAVNAADYDRIYPLSQPDPWRLARNADPNWVEFYGERETIPNGYFTGACGAFIYRGGALPEAYVGHHFACAPANNLVHRSVLTRDGAGFRVARATGEAESEFLSTPDRWFRPINLETGPDGALYIVDFYREIIEDYSAIPRHLQQRYVESLRAGYQHGRIWRVTAKNAQSASGPGLTSATIAGLVAALESPNPWDRETAQRLIIKRPDENKVDLLRVLLRNSNVATARLYGLYTLERLKALEPRDVERALSDTSFGVRAHALRLAERWMDTSTGVRDSALALADDSDPTVRLQAAQSFGACSHPAAVDALAAMALNSADNRWMSTAIVSSSNENADDLIGKLVESTDFHSAVANVIRPLATTLAAQGQVDAIERRLEDASKMGSASAPAVQLALLDGLADGIAAGGNKSDMPHGDYEGLVRLLTSSDATVRERALHVAGMLEIDKTPAMHRTWKQAQATVSDRSLSAPARIAAANLLLTAPWEHKAPLAALLDPREPLELQLAVVDAFKGADQEEVAAILVESIEAASPRVQEAILDAMFVNVDRLDFVLDSIATETITAAIIPPIRRLQLLESSSDVTSDRARGLFEASRTHERAGIIEEYRSALALQRNVERGRLIFEERCAVCHVLHGAGFDVGPGLSAVRSRPDEVLLSDILDPSGVITAGFGAYLVTTKDANLYTGVLADESATSITLRNANGQEDVILRNQIVEMRTSPVSLMPDGLEDDLVPQDIADLLGYIRDSAGDYLHAGLVVFEDEPEFPEALADGGGTVELSAESPYSGAACLRVTPLQRYSPRVEGWRFRVVEDPVMAAGGVLEEIRYLRLAWRSEGDGVMIELADDGRWPPSESPVRRYYSGKNLTDWQATRITGTVPKDWVVITVDLWKDFGEFALTGIAPTAMGGPAYFDRIEFLASIDAITVNGMSASEPVPGSAE